MKAKVVLCDVCEKPIRPDDVYLTIVIETIGQEKPRIKADVCQACASLGSNLFDLRDEVVILQEGRF